MDLFVPVMPSTAARLSYTAGSTCHGGQMSPPLSSCQHDVDTSSSPAGSVSRTQSAPQLGKQRKRKGAVDWCNCSNVHTCQVHKAQANFRKSLRRGFLSPLAAQGSGEEHVSLCEAGGGHPASSQVTPCTLQGPLPAP